MIDFAKSASVKNQDALIAAAITYRKHPRNTEDIGGGVILSIPYCTKQPRNQELVGVVNDQLPGVNPDLFGGSNSPVIPFGAGMSLCLFHDGAAQANGALYMALAQPAKRRILLPVLAREGYGSRNKGVMRLECTVNRSSMEEVGKGRSRTQQPYQAHFASPGRNSSIIHHPQLL